MKMSFVNLVRLNNSLPHPTEVALGRQLTLQKNSCENLCIIILMDNLRFVAILLVLRLNSSCISKSSLQTY